MRYLAAHNVKFSGVIKPATYAQINPALGKIDEVPKANSVTHLIENKLQGKNVIDTDGFIRKYSLPENQGKYLFRGHTFATGDPASSYATPTWRPGRTGIAYATSDPRYVTGYASNSIAGKIQVAGETMDLSHHPQVNGHLVGFVSVYKSSPRNPLVGDFGLETVTTGKELQKSIDGAKRTWVKETIVSPYNNPLVERYMIAGDKMVKVEENDPTWKQILDAMAPDLYQTHIGAVGAWGAGQKQEAEGRKFLQRVDALAEEYAHNGAVKTHDIPNDVLEKMGYKDKGNEFKHATQNLLLDRQTQIVAAQGAALE